MRDLEMRNYPGLSRWVLIAILCILMREGQVKISQNPLPTLPPREDNVKEEEAAVIRSQDKECQQPAEARRERQGPDSLTAFQVNAALLTHLLMFQATDLW